MSSLIPSMRANGWVIRQSPPGTWRFRSPHGASWSFTAGQLRGESVRQTLLEENDRVQHALNTGALSPWFGTATLLQPPLPPDGAPIATHIAKHHLAKGLAVLRLRTDPDDAGSETLRHHGAWRVETLLPPWDTSSVNLSSDATRFSVILCEHLIDTLPVLDRKPLYGKLLALTPPLGQVYFNAFQMSALPTSWRESPFEDGYLIPYGPHQCFVKPYNEAMLHREIDHALPGTVERGWTACHELTCSWRPHA
jgi:hypothetical protein